MVSTGVGRPCCRSADGRDGEDKRPAGERHLCHGQLRGGRIGRGAGERRAAGNGVSRDVQLQPDVAAAGVFPHPLTAHLVERRGVGQPGTGSSGLLFVEAKRDHGG